MKWTFRQIRHAESLLRAIFPDEVSALVRWGTVLIEDGGDVNATLSARHRDLLLSIQLRDWPGRLGALIEQQRNVEPHMMLRACDYLGRTWQRLARDSGPGRLPPLVAILIYNGERPWSAPTAFQEMVDLPGTSARPQPSTEASVPAAALHPGAAWLAQHIPHFKVHMLDLHNGRMDGVNESALTPLSRVVLWCLSVAGNDELLEKDIGRIAGPLGEVLREPDATDALEALLRYLAATHPGIPATRIRAIVENVSGMHAQEVIVSFLDEIENEGKKKGREEERQAFAGTLMQLLVRRFGSLSQEVQERVREADNRALRRWMLRVLDAATAEDVLRSKQPVPRKNGAHSPRRPAARAASRA